MWAEIARLAGDDPLAILLTTHYLEEADRLAGRLAIVDKGWIVAEGSPDTLKATCAATPCISNCVRRPTSAGFGPSSERSPGSVRSCWTGAGSVPARDDDGAAAVPIALAALDQAGLSVAAVTVARPSLDDVYLRHAGRRFVQADAPVAAAVGGAR